jgi:hypothetical protein
MFPSACSFLVFFTVADKHRRKETTKITKENREKHKWKHAECDHVKKGGKKKN